MVNLDAKENVPGTIPEEILQLAGSYSEDFEGQGGYMKTKAESLSEQHSLEAASCWLATFPSTRDSLGKTEIGTVNVLVTIIGAHTRRIESRVEALRSIFRAARHSLPLVQRKEVVSNAALKNVLKSVFVSELGGQARERLVGFFDASSQNVHTSEDTFCLWSEFLDTSPAAMCHIKLLNVIWSKIRAILSKSSQALMQADSAQFKTLMSRTFQVIVKHRDDTLSTIKTQLKTREKARSKKGEDAGHPASPNEKVLPAVQILRYFYGTIQALVKMSPGRVAIEIMNEFLVRDLLNGMSLVHPSDGVVNADPVTARMLQGFIHNNTITIFINLCNSEHVHIDEKLSLFRHLRPLIFSIQEDGEESLLGHFPMDKIGSRECDSQMELVKFELLLTILRTTPKFPGALVARMVPYLRWTVGVALHHYPVLASSPSQVHRYLGDLGRKSKDKNDFSAPFGIGSGGNAQGEDENQASLLAKLIAAIRLFLLDAPDSVAPALDDLLVEMSAHTSPTCQTLVKSMWSVAFDRRTTEESVGAIVSLYGAARNMGSCPPAASLIDTVGSCLVLLGHEQQTVAMQKLFSRFPKMFLAESSDSGTSCISDVDTLKEGWAFCQLLKTLHWERVLPNCPKVTNFFRSGLLKTALSCTLVGLAGTIESVQRFLCGLKCSVAIVEGLNRINVDIPQSFLDQAWSSIKAAMPLLSTGLPNLAGSGGGAGLEKRFLLLLECGEAVAHAGCCFQLVRASTLESEVLPWIDFLGKMIRAFERVSPSLMLSMQMAAGLGVMGFLRHSSGRSFSSIKWVKRLGEKRGFDKFAAAFHRLIDALCTGLTEGNSWIHRYALLELLSLCLRFDFGPYVANTKTSNSLSSWCVPDKMFESVMRHHGTARGAQQRPGVHEAEREYMFDRTSRSVLEKDGVLTVSVLRSFYEASRKRGVGLANGARGDPGMINKLREGVGMVQNGLEVVRKNIAHLNAVANAGREKGKNGGLVLGQGTLALRSEMAEKLKAAHREIGDILKTIG